MDGLPLTHYCMWSLDYLCINSVEYLTNFKAGLRDICLVGNNYIYKKHFVFNVMGLFIPVSRSNEI